MGGRRTIFNPTAVYCIVGILAGLAVIFFAWQGSDNLSNWSMLRSKSSNIGVLDYSRNPENYFRATQYLFFVYLGCLAIIFGAITACKSFSLIYHRRHDHRHVGDMNTFTFVLSIIFLILLCIGLAIFTAGVKSYGVHMGGWFILFASVLGVAAALFCEFTWWRVLQFIAAIFTIAAGIYGVINPPYVALLFV